METMTKSNFENAYNQVSNYLEMSKSEAEFLYNLILEKKPKKVLEVGVSSGASAYLILCALNENNNGATLSSIDIVNYYYKDKNLPVGFLVEDIYKSKPNNWKLYNGGVSGTFIDEIGSDIDFVLLDSARGLPGELLDFLVTYPYTKNATSFASKALLSTVSADKIYPKKWEGEIYNIAAFTTNDETKKNIEDVLSSLLIKWVRVVTKEHAAHFRNIIAKHYPENLLRYFDIACEKFRFDNLQNLATLQNKTKPLTFV